MEENPILIAHAKELCRACGMPIYEAIEAIKRVSKPRVFIGVGLANGRDFSGPCFPPHLIDAAVGRWEKIRFDPIKAWAAMQLPQETLIEVKKLAYLAAREMLSQKPVSAGYSIEDAGRALGDACNKLAASLSETRRAILALGERPQPKKNALRFLDGLHQYSKFRRK